MQQELLTLSEHLISPSFFSEVHVALVFSTIDCLFGLFLSAIVYLSIEGFWLPCWYLKTFFPNYKVSTVYNHLQDLTVDQNAF